MGQLLFIATEKVWRIGRDKKFSPLLWLQCLYSFLKSTEEITTVQEALHSLITIPTTVHRKAFHMIT